MCWQCMYHCTLTTTTRLNISVENIQPSDREKAKRVVYAIVYGVGKQEYFSHHTAALNAWYMSYCKLYDVC